MKFLYVDTHRLPNRYAHSVQIFNSCAALAQSGASVALLAKHQGLRRGERVAARKWPLSGEDYFGVPPAFELVSPRHSVADVLRRRSSQQSFCNGVLFYARRHRAQWDVIFTRIGLVALECARQGFPVVLEVHDLDCLQEDALQTLRRELAPAPQSSFLGLVAISQTLADGLVAAGIAPETLLVAHDGIDLARFQNPLSTAQARRFLQGELDAPDLLAETRFVAGYCGHFYEGRGLEMLIECARRQPNWTFLLVGGFPEDVERVRQLAGRFGLRNVIFTGYVPNTRLAPYLWACDALTMPYETARSASNFMSPMKMFEYMATGRAIVSADWPQIREVLRAGDNALLHPRGDVDGLEAALHRLDADAALRLSLAERAAQDVREFTWRKRAQRILEWTETRLAVLDAAK